MLDEHSGERASGIAVMRNGGGCQIWGDTNRLGPRPDAGYTDSGGASRFLFVAKGDSCGSNGQRVNGAVLLCGSCGTPIAGVPAAARISGSSGETRDPGQGSTSDFGNSTQRPDLASRAASRDGTVITLTIPNFCESCGCALDAIALPINSGASGKVAVGRDLEQATRFFYSPKASRAEREEGCRALPLRTAGEATDMEDGTDGLNSPRAGAGRSAAAGVRNYHPTVKPIALMRWLVRLVTPPGGHVLDPFMGSGTTGIAAALEDFHFTGIEIDPEYARIAEARIAYWKALPRQEVLAL